MARDERQCQNQLVLDQRLRIERRCRDQDFGIAIRIKPSGFVVVAREQELGALGNRPFERSETALALERHGAFKLDGKRRAPYCIRSTFDPPFDLRMRVTDAIGEPGQRRRIHPSRQRFALAGQAKRVEPGGRSSGACLAASRLSSHLIYTHPSMR
jgi:hypothetical protein